MSRERDPSRYSGARLPMRETVHPHYGDPINRFPEREITRWLADHPAGGTAHTIQAALKYKTRNWVANHLAQLHKAGRVYIADYERHAVQGPPRIVYALRRDNEPDFPPPKALTGTEKTNRYRQKQRALRLIQQTAGEPNGPRHFLCLHHSVPGSDR
jgi:hypothetical protein